MLAREQGAFVVRRGVLEQGMTVIGGGAWGRALAAVATRADTPVTLVTRRGRSGDIPDGVHVEAEIAKAVEHSRLIVLAVPSAVVSDVARKVGDHTDGRHLLVHGIRGLVGSELSPVSDVIRAEVPSRRIGALGGPALALELLAGAPSAIVCGSNYPEVTEALADAVESESLRVYHTLDLTGLEWASALVGCLAIGVGYATRLGLGPGIVAALISRGVDEGAAIAADRGGGQRTLLGLAGYGDLLASLAQEARPEVRLGRALAEGEPLDRALASAELRVEAIDLIPHIAKQATDRGLDTPIFQALSEMITSRVHSTELIARLMTLPRRALPAR